MRTQERIEGMIEVNQKKSDVKLEDDHFMEEAKMSLIKKINQGSVTNQYQTPTKEKNFSINDMTILFNKGKTESTLNFCNFFIVLSL